MKEILNILLFMITTSFYILGTVSPVYAAVIDIKADRIGWGVIDILAFPIGAIRGICLFFGWV